MSPRYNLFTSGLPEASAAELGLATLCLLTFVSIAIYLHKRVKQY